MNNIKFVKLFKFNENKTNINNVNINLEVENSVENFSINERKNIVNIRNVEGSHRINFMFFKENKIIKTFDKFCYNDINKHSKDCIYVFVIVVLWFIVIFFIVIVFVFVVSTSFKILLFALFALLSFSL